jgi:peroxiredoxin
MKEIEAHSTKIVVISPETSEELKSIFEADSIARSYKFPVLSDSSLNSFKEYGCHDGRVLHGIFLLDSNARICWRQIGDEPFDDFAALLLQITKIRSTSAR